MEPAFTRTDSASRRLSWPPSHKDHPEHLFVTPRREERTFTRRPLANAVSHLGQALGLYGRAAPVGAQSPFLTTDLLWHDRYSTTETHGTTSHGAFHG